MLKKLYNFLFLFLIAFIAGCSKDNPVNSVNETLVFQRDGIIESLGGDCSAVQIRTSSFGTLDFTGSSKIKFNFNASSDADLSSLTIYYVQNNNQINLVNLSDRDQINRTQTVEINSPNYEGEILLRVTLKSSVCTGQIFYLEVRDLKIFTLD